MWRNNNLSIVLGVLFLLCLLGQAVAGWKTYNAEQRQHGQRQVSLREFVTTGEFGETVFENWESEFLQMAFFVILTVFLHQRGSAESKKHDGTDEVDADPLAHQDEPGAPFPVKAGGWRLMLYRSSLSLVLSLMFLFSFVGHGVTGARKHNEEQLAHGSKELVSTVAYMQTPEFWYESFQNWQSEFLAVLAIVVLSIWLRQWGSPQSKPVHAPHAETGGA